MKKEEEKMKKEEEKEENEKNEEEKKKKENNNNNNNNHQLQHYGSRCSRTDGLGSEFAAGKELRSVRDIRLHLDLHSFATLSSTEC
jgi:hypothetical protein